MQRFEELVQAVEAVRRDVEKTERGNKAAGTRVRGAMQQVKKLAQEIRKDVLSLRDTSGPEA